MGLSFQACTQERAGVYMPHTVPTDDVETDSEVRKLSRAQGGRPLCPSKGTVSLRTQAHSQCPGSWVLLEPTAPLLAQRGQLGP